MGAARLATGLLLRTREQAIDGKAERGSERVERPDGGARLPRLDLGYQAGREADPLGELTKADPATLASRP